MFLVQIVTRNTVFMVFRNSKETLVIKYAFGKTSGHIRTVLFGKVGTKQIGR